MFINFFNRLSNERTCQEEILNTKNWTEFLDVARRYSDSKMTLCDLYEGFNQLGITGITCMHGNQFIFLSFMEE